MDAAQWPKALVYDFHKEIGHVNNPSGGSCDIIPGSNSPSSHSKQDKKKQTKPNKDQALNCPRCNSTNTKFCYYNNYNPTQPRYLCKACRRYWTHGGTLRNVPVGGSSRKKNRPSSSLAPNSLSNNSKLFLDLNPKPTTMLANFSSSVPLNPTRSFMHEINNHDLNMGLYYANAHHHHFLPIPQNYEISASQGGLSSYHVPMSETNTRLLYPSSGFHFQDIIKPTLNLSMDGGLGGGAGSRTTPYPFGELKQDSTTSSAENVMDQTNGDTRDHSNNGVVYWNNNGLYN
ncbi:unnamed protein product [Rhodiola kirilowii]